MDNKVIHPYTDGGKMVMRMRLRKPVQAFKVKRTRLT